MGVIKAAAVYGLGKRAGRRQAAREAEAVARERQRVEGRARRRMERQEAMESTDEMIAAAMVLAEAMEAETRTAERERPQAWYSDRR